MFSGFHGFAEEFTQGLLGIIGMASQESQLGELTKNIAATVISLLIAGGVGGGIVAWSNTQQNQQQIDQIEATQDRILNELEQIRGIMHKNTKGREENARNQ